MGSIEADVHWVNNQLYVAHDAKDLNPNATLDNLYLKPLAKAIRRRKAYPMILLIDIKSVADSTLQAIEQQIAHYAAFVKPNCPIKFVISGNRPRSETWATHPSYIQFDGRPFETYSLEAWQRIGIVSDNFEIFK